MAIVSLFLEFTSDNHWISIPHLNQTTSATSSEKHSKPTNSPPLVISSFHLSFLVVETVSQNKKLSSSKQLFNTTTTYFKTTLKMADDEDIAALVVDNGSGMCKGEC
jgi:hypothetical protein